MNNINITLPVLFTTPESEQLEFLGLGTSVEQLETRNTTFYSIDVIAPYLENPSKPMTEIISGGISFICTYSYEVLWDKLNTIYQDNKKYNESNK